MSETLADPFSLFAAAPDSVAFGKLRKRLAREVAETIATYAMVSRPGARWMVCLSGGKDSYTLLGVLMDLKARGQLPVDLVAGHLDQAQPGYPPEVLPDFLAAHGIPYRIDRRDTYSTVIEKTAPGATLCTLCSRLRRGNLYRMAREEGCEAIVLGHHGDDVLATFFMNLFHGARLEAMPPKLKNEEGDLLVLRPLALSAEADCAAYAAALNVPIIPCTLCGSQDGMERQRVGQMLAGWEASHPGRRAAMLRALTTVRPGHLLDPALFDFSALQPAR